MSNKQSLKPRLYFNAFCFWESEGAKGDTRWVKFGFRTINGSVHNSNGGLEIIKTWEDADRDYIYDALTNPQSDLTPKTNPTAGGFQFYQTFFDKTDKLNLRDALKKNKEYFISATVTKGFNKKRGEPEILFPH